MSTAKDNLTFLLGLIAGMVAGGVAAAFLIPQSGDETRRQVAERGLELKGRAEDVVSRAQHVASETVAKIQISARDLISRGAGQADGAGGS